MAAPTRVPDELIIKFKAGATDMEIADALDQGGLTVRQQVHTQRMRAAGMPKLSRTRSRLGIDEAMRRLKRHRAVEFAEPNFIYRHQAVSNDPRFLSEELWGTYGEATTFSNKFGSQAALVWAEGYTGSKHVYVGVIDEGIQFDHPDLVTNIWTNPFDPADGEDNDGNGYVDDVHGWNFHGENNVIYEGSMDDHGTHVAGTIGAAGGNAVGVAGVNWKVTMISAKFLGPEGGTTLDAVRAIDYFVDLKTRHGLNLVVLNNSWGGGDYSQALHEAIIRAAKAGILFVAAAGNGNDYGFGVNNDAIPMYPSNYDTRVATSGESAADFDGVIAVAALDKLGRRARFSNYGLQTVDLAAPGVDVLSTLPGGQYGLNSGTSMATPHVAGAIALHASMYPHHTAAQIRSAVINAAAMTPTPGVTNRCVTHGRLNLARMLADSGVPPSLSVSTVAVPAGGGSTTGGGSYQPFSDITVNATPHAGCRFLNWTEDGEVVSSAATLNFAVGANRALVANFVPLEAAVLTLDRRANQQTAIVVKGAAAQEYTVVVSTNLIDWAVLQSGTTDNQGRFEIVVPTAPSPRYYRARTQ